MEARENKKLKATYQRSKVASVREEEIRENLLDTEGKVTEQSISSDINENSVTPIASLKRTEKKSMSALSKESPDNYDNYLLCLNSYEKNLKTEKNIIEIQKEVKEISNQYTLQWEAAVENAKNEWLNSYYAEQSQAQEERNMWQAKAEKEKQERLHAMKEKEKKTREQLQQTINKEQQIRSEEQQLNIKLKNAQTYTTRQLKVCSTNKPIIFLLFNRDLLAEHYFCYG